MHNPKKPLSTNGIQIKAKMAGTQCLKLIQLTTAVLFKLNQNLIQFALQLDAINTNIQNQKMAHQWIILFQALDQITILLLHLVMKNLLPTNLNMFGFGKRSNQKIQLNMRSDQLKLILKIHFQISETPKVLMVHGIFHQVWSNLNLIQFVHLQVAINTSIQKVLMSHHETIQFQALDQIPILLPHLAMKNLHQNN